MAYCHFSKQERVQQLVQAISSAMSTLLKQHSLVKQLQVGAYDFVGATLSNVETKRNELGYW